MTGGKGWSREAAWQEGTDALSRAGVEEARLDAWYLLEHVTGLTRARYFADPGKPLSAREVEDYRRCIEKRAMRIPLQHITGQQMFMGLPFAVNQDVLIPRQDTECLVECALELIDNGTVLRKEGKIRLLDLCTGSGCILLSVLCHAKSPIEGVGSDFSARALQVAERNRQALGLEAGLIQSDLFEGVFGQFQLILSNPPYIPTADIDGLSEEVRFGDPKCALDGGKDGLDFYRRIVAQSGTFLTDQGVLAFEIGWDQAEAVKELMEESHFRQVQVKKDLAGLDRVVYGVYSDRVKM